MPLPGTRVVPDGWEQRHQPVVEATFTARVQLRDPSGDTQTWNTATGKYTTVKAAAYYDGPCRIQQLNRTQTAETAGQVEATHDYLVQIPKTVTAVHTGHLAVIYDATDTTLNGRELQVSDVLRGSLTWARDLTCIDTLGR